MRACGGVRARVRACVRLCVRGGGGVRVCNAVRVFEAHVVGWLRQCRKSGKVTGTILLQLELTSFQESVAGIMPKIVQSSHTEPGVPRCRAYNVVTLIAITVSLLQ